MEIGKFCDLRHFQSDDSDFFDAPNKSRREKTQCSEGYWVFNHTNKNPSSTMAKGILSQQKFTVVTFYTPKWSACKNTIFNHFHQGGMSHPPKKRDSWIGWWSSIYASPLDLDQSPILLHQTSVPTCSCR